MNDKLTKREELQRKYADAIKRFTLMDDTFLSAVFSDKNCAEILLRTILEKELIVDEVKTQYNIHNLKGHSSRLDIRARDKDGKLYNVEVQNTNEDAIPERARYNSSLMDAEELPKGSHWKELPDTYVIIITRNDVLGGNKPIYHIERTVRELNNTPFSDRSYIVYVNSKIQDNTALGRLMHDFHCKDPKDMYNKELADVVDDLKNGDEGDDNMCEIMDEIVREERLESAIETTIKNFKSLDASKEKTINTLVKDYGLPKDKAINKVEELWDKF